jgi:hypothetical protein
LNIILSPRGAFYFKCFKYKYLKLRPRGSSPPGAQALDYLKNIVPVPESTYELVLYLNSIYQYTLELIKKMQNEYDGLKLPLRGCIPLRGKHCKYNYLLFLTLKENNNLLIVIVIL